MRSCIAGQHAALQFPEYIRCQLRADFYTDTNLMIFYIIKNNLPASEGLLYANFRR